MQTESKQIKTVHVLSRLIEQVTLEEVKGDKKRQFGVIDKRDYIQMKISQNKLFKSIKK